MDAGPSQQPSEASKSSLSSWLPWSSSSSSSTPTPSTWDTPSTSQSTPTEPVMVADDTPSGTAVALDDSDQTSVSKRYNLRIPTSLLVLTPSAAVVGLFIGMRRGGEKARLRFLAENAHRQPTTVQGWYFYTKTRNYRVLFGALREGSRTALKLGIAGGLFAALEEGTGWLREHTLDPALTHEDKRTPPNPNRVGWRKGPVHFEDGAAAGSMLGLLASLIYRLPTPVALRTIVMGFGMGGAYSALKIAQDKIAYKQAEQEQLERMSRPEGETPENEKKSDWGWGWVWRIGKSS